MYTERKTYWKDWWWWYDQPNKKRMLSNLEKMPFFVLPYFLHTPHLFCQIFVFVFFVCFFSIIFFQTIKFQRRKFQPTKNIFFWLTWKFKFFRKKQKKMNKIKFFWKKFIEIQRNKIYFFCFQSFFSTEKTFSFLSKKNL